MFDFLGIPRQICHIISHNHIANFRPGNVPGHFYSKGGKHMAFNDYLVFVFSSDELDLFNRTMDPEIKSMLTELATARINELLGKNFKEDTK